MTTPADRERAFRAAAREELVKLPRLQAEHVRYAVQQLETAQSRVQALIRGSSTAASRAHWERVQGEIDRQLDTFRRAVSADLSRGIDAAVAAGGASVARPLAAGGAQLADDLFRLNPRAVAALRTAAVDRIKDVADDARGRIRSTLNQQLIGVLPRDQAIDQVNRALGGEARRRAMTIVDTEIGRAHAVAQHESMLQAAANGVPMRKRWQHSGKRKLPRGDHQRAHGQTVPVHEPFVILDKQSGTVEHLRFPRDPKASAKNTILCGCLSVPVVTGTDLEAVDTETGEVTPGLAQVPADPAAAIAIESAAAREARNRAAIEHAQRRLEQATSPGPASGLQVTRSGDAIGVLEAMARAAAESRQRLPQFEGLAPAQVAQLATIEAELATWAARAGAGERAYAVNASGEVSIALASESSVVRFEPEHWPLLRDAVVTHSHVTPTTFSIGDVEFAAQFGVREIRVVAPNEVFRLQPPPAGWPAALASIATSAEGDTLRRELRRYHARLQRQGLSEADRRQRVAEWLVLRLAKQYHLRYTRQRT